MIEPDSWLRDHAADLGIAPNWINPASVDLGLGAHIIEFRNLTRLGYLLERARIWLKGGVPTWNDRLHGQPVAPLSLAGWADSRTYMTPGRRDHHLWADQPFTFRPGRFYLAHSLEYTRCPPTHAWVLYLKSSIARLGLDHLKAAFGDPCFEGQITYEFQAARPVTLRCGQRVAQLVYHRLTGPCAQGYDTTGHYHGQTGATPAREHL